MGRVTIITVTLNRASLIDACRSVDCQTYTDWHHIILGDGLLPSEYTKSPQRSVLGFSEALGATEPGANMRNGTPNPLLRWALNNLALSDYVCFLDDDNQYVPTYLEKMTAVLDANPEIGLVLCGAADLRYAQDIDGYPALGRCDNSAFMARCAVAKSITFPYASLDKDVVQDYEFIKALSERYSWKRIDEKLLIFGSGMNPPPDRGEVLFLESWKLAQQASQHGYAKEYELAEREFLYALSLYQNDAWSWRKLGELYLIQGRKKEADNAFRNWYNLYTKVDKDHYAVQYGYAVYLMYLGMPYCEVMRRSVLTRAEVEKKECINDSLSYNTYYCMLSYLFMGDTEKARKYLAKCVAFDSERISWAFSDVAWTLAAYKEYIPVNIDDFVSIFSED